MNASSLSSEALAVVGMSCRLPGADGLDEFWELLRRGKTAWGPLPEDRLNRDLYFDPQKGVVGKSYSDLGGLIPDRPVDVKGCRIPDEWLQKCDIAHLICCEVAAAALRDAGYDPFSLPDRQVGVFIGHTGGSQRVCDLVYATSIEDEVRWLKSLGSLSALGQDGENVAAEIVRRVRAKYPKEPGETPDFSGLIASSLVSRLFGLNGPHLVVDAACASSFQALSVGARALRQGRLNMALVGGASYCKSDSLVLFSQAQSVSSTGSCPFSASADGLITAEGYVIFALKTLERAIADGNRIHAIIRGIGVASDGKGKSLWAPRKEGQILAVHRAYGKNVDVSQLQYIEAHATSTQVGDATELSALSEALTGRLPPGVKLPIGSVKGNIGHTLETAGVAGMLKTILAMKHGIVPPAVQRGDLNTTIEWKDCPFYVPFREERWPEPKNGQAKRAAVNAFGIGGLNVHIVLDEYQPQSRSVSVSAPRRHSATPEAATLETATLADDDKAVAVVGAGCIFAGAFTLEAFWNLLVSGTDPKTEAPVERWASDVAYSPGEYRPYHTYNRLGGFVAGYAYDWRRHKVPPKQVAQANPLQFMLLDAADQAFHDSGYHEKKLDRTRVGVVVGTMFGGDFSNQLQLGIRLPEFNETLAEILRERGVASADVKRVTDEFRKRLMEKMPALIDETGSFTSSTLASRITKTFNLMGGAMALDAGGCSSLAALQASVDILREGSCDMVVCAAGQRAMDLMTFEGLAEPGLLSHGSPHAGFDTKADGVVPGEGCAVVLLKRLSDARRDGDRIRAVIRAVAGHHGDEHNQHSLAGAMQSALDEAGISADRVVGLEPIGYGLPESDHDELKQIEQVYGGPRTVPLHVGGLRSLIGDTGAASGMASVLKAALCLENKVLPATFQMSQPIPELAQLSDRVQPAIAATPLPAVSDKGYRAFGVSSVHNDLTYHLIMDNGAPKPAPTAAPEPSTPARTSSASAPPSKPSELSKASPARIDISASDAGGATVVTWRAAVNDWQALESKLKDVAAQPELAFANGVPNFRGQERVRCAIVADSPASLSKRARMAVETIRHGTGSDALLEQGIICVERGKHNGQVAVLMPGQGSQYPGMLRDMCQNWPAANQALSRFDRVLNELGLESFESLAWSDGEGLGKDIWRTQASVLIANSIAWEVLAAAGLHPDFIAAHSFGEFPALFAAGAWSFREAALATRARCSAVSASQASRGTMLSVFAPLPDVDRLLSTNSARVWICAENGPEQVVVGGLSDEAEKFGEVLRRKGIKFKTLPVPCPFHTPLLGDAQPQLRKSLSERAITPPRIPMISSTSGRFIVEPDEIRTSLVKQFTEPVHFRTVVDRLYELGVRLFVEAGPNQVLTQLAKRILSGRDDVLFTSIDHSSRSGVEQLARLLAFLEAHDRLNGKAPPGQEGFMVATKQTALHFDATEKRRQRKRTQSRGEHAAAPVELPRSSTPPNRMETKSPSNRGSEIDVAAKPGRPTMSAPTKVREGSHLGNGSNGNGSVSDTPERVVATSATSRMTNLSTSSVKDTLREYLVHFVVEQTGYPPEIVEIDADLEADLGIDSIKKAQLFGELGEEFSLRADENLSLDDFPTLQHVLEYLISQPSVLSNRRFATRTGEETDVAPSTKSAAVSDAGSTPPATSLLRESRGNPATRNRRDLEASIENLLIQFVVDQTGYPPDIVDLDADLEADLGIDSIKKAQLFGEIGERFDLRPDENMSLDDFPTLRHVRTYLLSQPNVVNDREVDSFTYATAGHESSENAPASAGTITTHTDLPGSDQPERTSRTGEDWDLEGLLVNFVVEQTGYPPEIVDLDVDLEADLGIDSIKKAQLFGEIGEQFRLTPDENLSLDDFPTLRHVLVYLKAALAERKDASPSPASTQQVVTANTATAPVAPPRREAIPASEMSEETQRAFEDGFLHGRSAKSEIGQAIQWMATQSISARSLATQSTAAGNGASSSMADVPDMETLTADEAAELRGIAEGSQVSPETILAWSFVAADLLNPDTSLWQSPSRETGLMASWSQPVIASVRTRHVGEGRKCLIMTVPGAVGAFAGVNENGIGAVLSTAEPESHVPESLRLPASILCLRVLHESATMDEALGLIRRAGIVSRGTLLLTQAASGQIIRVKLSPGRHPVFETVAESTSSEGRVLIRGGQSEPMKVGPNASAAGLLAQTDVQLSQRAPANASQRVSRHAAGIVVQSTKASAYLGVERSGQSIPVPGWRLSDAAVALEQSAGSPLVASEDRSSAVHASRPAISYDYEADSVTHRYVLRMKPLAGSGGADSSDVSGPVLIIGSVPLSQSLSKAYSQKNGRATVLATNGSLEETLRRYEASVQSGLPRHVIVATAADDNIAPRNADEWARVRDERLLAPFWIIQRWLSSLNQEGAVSQARLTAITAMGGDFGLSGRIASVESGGLAGLLKGIRNEYPALKVKVIDIPDPSAISVSEVIAELNSRDAETEIGLLAGRRWSVRPALLRASEIPAGATPRKGDVWVVTGGARGVTAVVAREIARTYGVQLHLLGTTISGGIDASWLNLDADGLKRLRSEIMVRARQEGKDALAAWRQVEKGIELARNLGEFAAAGVKPLYHACDVSDWNSLSRTLDQIRRQAGPIKGILHGAGFEAAAKFERKKPDPVRTTLSVKVGGAAALIALTKDDPVCFFIGFGSTSGRFGGIGQADYSLANEMLAKQLSQLRAARPACRATTFHWHAWGEVGMAARPESRFALEGFGLHLMPTREGVGHVLAELAAGLPEPEILITEPKLCPECVASDPPVSDVPSSDAVNSPSAVASPASSPVSELHASRPAETSSQPTVELEQFLINFVVEQTGYPPEIVELDADLEADLGIDSIKKAQLFGEIGETFKLTADPDLSLDDFPTLRHVLDYLQKQPGVTGKTATVAQPSPIAVKVTTSPTPRSGAADPSKSDRNTKLPLLDGTSTDAQEQSVSSISFDPTRDVFLQEHRLFGQPFLPAVVAIEALVEGALAAHPGRKLIGLTNVDIHNGLRFLNQQAVPCRVHVARNDQGSEVQARMVCDFVDRGGRVIDRDRPLISANVILGSEHTATVPPLNDPPFGYYPFYYIDDAAMYHGEKLRTLKGLLIQHDGGFAELKSPSLEELAGWRSGDGWQTPSALLDGCLVACAVFQFLMFARRVDIPQGFDRLEFFRLPRAGEVCRMQYWFRRRDERNSWYDFCLYDENRHPILFAEGFRCVTVNDGGR